MNTRKRLALGAGTITAIGAAATLIAGTTFGLFSATSPAQSGTFTAGTVSLTQTDTITCVIPTTVMPGDSSANFGANGGVSSTCSKAINYTGSEPAYLAVDVSWSGTAAASVAQPYPSPGTATPKKLYDPSDPTRTIQLQLTDARNTVLLAGSNTLGTSYKDASGTATTLPVAGAPDLLLSSAGGTPFTTTNKTDTLYVDYKLPAGMTNDYQGGTVTLTLTVHAVQAAHNPNAGTTCTVGWTCPNGSDISWS